ncbi:hypothetical protein BH09MYX1_BH09MYX1_20680 [soil metagenome]
MKALFSGARVVSLAMTVALAACNHTPAEPGGSSASATGQPTLTSAGHGDDSHGGATTAAATKPPAPRCVISSPAVAPPKALPAASCPPDPQGGPPFAKVANVSIPDASASVEVELALSDDETERGLMYRTKMADGHGMLFAMPERKQQTFWMRNTCISLDMMFIDDDGTIVGILENVPTVNDEIRSVACPSSWVLEVNGGFSRAHGVKAGQKVILPAVHPTR